jgi:acyl-CoA synthetase (NDP forming)
MLKPVDLRKPDQVSRPSLQRLLVPRSVAIVGASDKVSHLRGILEFMKDTDVAVYLVNPTQAVVQDRKAYASLSAIGTPVDAVLSLVNAERTVSVVAEAAETMAGGVVIFAAGFREIGEQGIQLEREMLAAAGTMPVIGPNCNGFTDFRRRVKISAHPPVSARAGSIGVVTHSGGMIGALALSGYDRAVGFSHSISVGNEAMVDLVDCLEFLVDDPATKAICLVIEQIRRPDAFFEAVGRATRAGKPVIALKLARAERSQRIARSHTGSIAGDAWVYDAAFRQHGVIGVRSLSEMLDCAACFDQLPVEKWSAMDGLAVLTSSGGGASLSSDVFSDSSVNVPLPEFTSIQADLQELIPGVDVANPLDMTGFAVGNKETHKAVFSLYDDSTEADAVMLQWFVNDAAMPLGGTMLESFCELARRSAKPFIISTIDDSRLSDWAADRAEEGISVLRGLEASVRAVKTMRSFMKYREQTEVMRSNLERLPLRAPSEDDIVDSDVGPMLRFDAAMKLLESIGIRVARYQIIDAHASLDSLDVSFSGPYVVKLADVPHRTEIGAVRVGVQGAAVRSAVDALRALADRLDLPREVVIQAQARIDGEAFIGIRAQTSIGPFVVCGVGGIFVEIFKKVAGARAPFNESDVDAMLAELDDTRVFEGARGATPWEREKFKAAVIAAGRLTQSAPQWLETIDINPLAFVEGEFIALDCLCTLRRPD